MEIWNGILTRNIVNKIQTIISYFFLVLVIRAFVLSAIKDLESGMTRITTWVTIYMASRYVKLLPCGNFDFV